MPCLSRHITFAYSSTRELALLKRCAKWKQTGRRHIRGFLTYAQGHSFGFEFRRALPCGLLCFQNRPSAGSHYPCDCWKILIPNSRPIFLRASIKKTKMKLCSEEMECSSVCVCVCVCLGVGCSATRKPAISSQRPSLELTFHGDAEGGIRQGWGGNYFSN